MYIYMKIISDLNFITLIKLHRLGGPIERLKFTHYHYRNIIVVVSRRKIVKNKAEFYNTVNLANKL